MVTEEQAEIVSGEPTPLNEDVLTSLRNAGVESPTDQDVSVWKETYGRIFALLFTDSRLCVVRPVSRTEMKELTRRFRNAVPTGNTAPSAEELSAHEEELAHTCLLFPKMTLEEMATKADAGLATTIYTTILSISGFHLADDPIAL